MNQTIFLQFSLWYRSARRLALAAMCLCGLLSWQPHHTGQAQSTAATGAWRTLAAMNVARELHTLTLLRDGRVLAVGGLVNNGQSSLASTEIFNPATGLWTMTGNLNEARSAHTATLLSDGRVLVVSARSAEIFDPATGSWKLTSPPKITTLNPQPYREGHTATLLPDGKVLILAARFGTTQRSGESNAVELYDPIADTWALSTGPVRPFHTATLLKNNKVLINGGPDEPRAYLYDIASGQWTQTGSIPMGRSYDTATLLPDGKVLLVGGSDKDGSTYLYNPITGTWSSAGNLNRARLYHKAALLSDGRVLIVGGYQQSYFDRNHYFSSSEIFDPATKQWIVGPYLSTPRYRHDITALADGRVLLAGGSQGNGAYKNVAVFDLARKAASGLWGLYSNSSDNSTNRQWHTATLLPDGGVLIAGGGFSSSLSTATVIFYGSGSPIFYGSGSPAGQLAIARRYHTATALIDGRVLVVGGEQLDGTALPSAEIFNPQSNAWRTTRSMAQPRRRHTATLLADGRVLVAGGANSQGEATDAEIYDPLTEQWSTTRKLNVARSVHIAAALPDGRVLVAGGDNNGIQLNSAEIFDPVTGQWSLTNPLKFARHLHTATVLINGKILVAGGAADNFVAMSELYDPATGSWRDAGLLNAPRQTHTATLLTDGRVLITGGLGNDTVLAGAEIFDPAANNGAGDWQPTGSMDQVRLLHTATLLTNGKVAVIGGAFPFFASEGFDPARVIVPPPPPLAVTTVSASTFQGSPLAAESIVAIFGGRFTDSVVVATTNPLPTELGKVRVGVTDRTGTTYAAPLFFVSPTQINCQIPPGLILGAVKLYVTADVMTTSEDLILARVAPGLFSADASGKGLAAAVVLRVKENGQQVYEPVAQFDPAQNGIVAVPIELSNPNEQVFLILYGTGLRLRSSLSAVSASVGGQMTDVLYAGLQGEFIGLDQVNLPLPRSLAGRGEVEVQVTADGISSNVVKVSIK